MATTNVVGTKTAIAAAINAAASGDVLKIAAGTIAPMWWPSNTTKTLTLAPQVINNPPVFQGLSLSGDSSSPRGQFVPHTGDAAGTCQNVTFDGLKFEAARLTEVRQVKNANGTYNTVQVRDIPSDGLGGFNWRGDTIYEPDATNLKEGRAIDGLLIGSGGSHHITVRNNQFIGFANALAMGGHDNLIEWNDFRYNCEDMIKMFQGDDTLFQYNRCRDFRGVTYYDAVNAWDWGPDGGSPNAAEGVPPHADFFQIPGNADLSNISIISNYLHDNSCRVHGVLFNGSGDHLKMNFNELRMTHTTGLEVGGPVTNIEARGNKIYRLRSIPKGIENPTGDKNDTKMYLNVANIVPIDYSNNVCRKFWPTSPPGTWTVDNKDPVNSDTIFPDNWTHIREFYDDGTTPLALPGDPVVGAYGQGGTPPNPSGAAMQDADFNMLGAIPDPAFPSPDTRMTGCIELPPTSIAYSMPSIWWGDSDDAPLPTVYLGTTTGNAKLYRLASAAPKAADYHMKSPSAFFSGIYVYYKDVDGVISLKSAVTCRFTTPAVADRTVVYVKPRT